MPSLMCTPQSGGSPIVSGDIFSGYPWPFSEVVLRLAISGAGPVYVCIPNLSGSVCTMLSGGALSSGGMADGWELAPNNEYSVPKSRLRITTSGVNNIANQWQAGIQDIRIQTPAGSSGVRLFWEVH